jgi:sensor histidine kinase regulating citrate/malate metabolism
MNLIKTSKVLKAQSSIEILMLVGAMMAIFLSFLYVFQQNLTQKSSEQRVFEVQELATFLQNELNIAASASNGYERMFNLPAKIIGQDYSIEILDDFVYIQTNDGISLALPAQTIIGQPLQGTNTIRKVNGAICLNNQITPPCDS